MSELTQWMCTAPVDLQTMVAQWFNVIGARSGSIKAASQPK